MSLVRAENFELESRRNDFLKGAIQRFQSDPESMELFAEVEDDQGPPTFQYVMAIRKSTLSRLRGGAEPGATPPLDAVGAANPLEMILLVRMHTDLAQKQLTLNRLYILGAGLLAGLLAIFTFWYITTRIILSPVSP